MSEFGELVNDLKVLSDVLGYYCILLAVLLWPLPFPLYLAWTCLTFKK